MNLPSPSKLSQAAKRAFSLIELLSVIAIASVLMALAAPAMTSLMESSNLTRAGQMLADQIRLARQIASAKNRTIEVRLIKLPDGPAKGYSGMQLWSMDPNGTLTPIAPIAVFPQNTVIAEDETQLSEGLSEMIDGTMPAESGTAANAAFTSFHIQPSGLVSPLIEMSQFYLTVVTTPNAANTTLPNNYVTVQVNPNTGTPLIYRP